MTQKTINCAECNVEVTYEENPRFPRKYCVKCSAQKKASFEAQQNEEPEVVKVDYAHPNQFTWKKGEKPKAEPVGVKPRDNGFALTIGNVRSNALASAIEWFSGSSPTLTTLMTTAKEFEQYILTGE